MVFDLLIYDPQGLRVLGGNDNAAGVPVDPVAQGGRKGVLPFGIPLFFLVQVGLNVVDELSLIHIFCIRRPKATFSNTFMWGNRAYFWNTVLICRR